MSLSLCYLNYSCVHSSLFREYWGLDNLSSRFLPVKVHLKRKSGGRKTQRCPIVNKIPYRTTSSFFRLRFFFRGELLRANSRYLHPPYSFYGEVTGYCHSGARLGWGSYFIWILYSNIHMFTIKKNILRNNPCKIWDRICNPS